METFVRILEKTLFSLMIPCTRQQLETCATYTELLLAKNEQMNLTTIVDLEEIAIKHFADSLILLRHTELPLHASLIDIGSGNGFPGVALSIFRPDVSVTLLESTKKRCDFLRQLIEKLQLTNAVVRCNRAEEAARESDMRNQFDFATARAVAPLPTLIEYTIPFLHTGGKLLALKGSSFSEEIFDAQNALDALNCEISDIYEYLLPETEDNRTIIEITKLKETDDTYPRRTGIPSKRPL